MSGMATEPRLGTKIRRARERKRWTQQQLADHLGVSRSAVNAWENDRMYPQASIGALEDILGISFGDEPEPGPPDDDAADMLEQAAKLRADAAELLEAAARLRRNDGNPNGKAKDNDARRAG